MQVFSNRQAPERDAAYRFADQLILKHMMDGCSWTEGNKW